MTDQAFRAWIQTLPSCLSGNFSEYLEDGRRLCVAAHVRRAGESGIGYKAPYSTVPLTQTEHAYQHNFGELACLLKFYRNQHFIRLLKAATPSKAESLGKGWFNAQIEEYRARWKEITGQSPWERQTLNA